MVHDRWWRLDHGPWRIARSQRGVGAERSLLEGGQRQGHVAPGGFGSATSARMRKFSRKSPKNPFKGLYSIKERSGGVFSAKKWGFSSRRRRLSGHRRSCPWCDRSGARRRAGGGVPGRSVDSAPAQPGLRASDRSTLGPRPATADRPRCRDHGLGPPTGARLGAGSMRRSRVVRDL